MRRETAITVAATGVNIATGATSSNVAIPNTSAGTRPNFVRVTATQPAYVRLGGATVAAVAGDLMVQPADSAILAVGGNSYIAGLQVSSAGVVNVVPLDDVS